MAGIHSGANGWYTLTRKFTFKGTSPTKHFCTDIGQWMHLNFVPTVFTQRNVVADFLQVKCDFTRKMAVCESWLSDSSFCIKYTVDSRNLDDATQERKKVVVTEVEKLTTQRQAIGNSLSIGLRTGYSHVHTAGGTSDRHWLKAYCINGLIYLLTYDCIMSVLGIQIIISGRHRAQQLLIVIIVFIYYYQLRRATWLRSNSTGTSFSP